MEQKNEADSEKGLMPFEVIKAACGGDFKAIEKVIRHYDSFINMKAKREIRMSDGRYVEAIDYELREYLVMRLIEAILAFRI